MITISDSDDEVPEPAKEGDKMELVSGATSGCPNVMTVTPVI